MKKIILAVVILFTAHFFSFSQPVANTGKIEMQKTDKISAVIELPYDPDIVEKAIKDNMLKNGVRDDVSKGWQIYKGVRMTPTDGELADLYFKVDRKSRRDKSSVVNLIVGRPNENVALRTVDESYRNDEAKTYLSTIVPVIEAYNLEVQITDQSNLISKQEKKLNNLQDDQKSLESKMRSLEDKISQNKKDIESQTSEIEKQRQVKDAMQARRITK
ncbi:MAG: hypothetical protein ABI415_00340 [Flavitalea sp.]